LVAIANRSDTELRETSPESLGAVSAIIDDDLDERFAFDHADQEPGQLRRFTIESMGYYVTIDDAATLTVEPKPEQPDVE
jgi:hypothetical protein